MYIVQHKPHGVHCTTKASGSAVYNISFRVFSVQCPPSPSLLFPGFSRAEEGGSIRDSISHTTKIPTGVNFTCQISEKHRVIAKGCTEYISSRCRVIKWFLPKHFTICVWSQFEFLSQLEFCHYFGFSLTI